MILLRKIRGFMIWMYIMVINIIMGGDIQKQNTQNEIYLSEVEGWGSNQLMFQSKLSSVGYETKLIRKVFVFNSSSDNVNGYLQKYY